MTCLVDGCNNPVEIKSAGLCRPHYARSRNGVPLDRPWRKPAKGQPCEFNGCNQERTALGLCKAHYSQLRNGVPLKPRRGNERTLAERFWSKVDKGGPDDCWIWTGSRNQLGYGQMTYRYERLAAHRVSLELAGHYLVTGMDVDHLCRNPSCVNPAHLEQVTHRENVLRGALGAVSKARHAARTHCKNGHEFTVENTRVDKRGSRICRACQRRWQAEYQARSRGQNPK